MSAFGLRRSIPCVSAPRSLKPVVAFPIIENRTLHVVHANSFVKKMYKLSEDEIVEQVMDLKEELFTMRTAQAVGNPVKTHLFKKYRKQIAQLLTVKRAKEIEQGINKRESRKREKHQLLEADAYVR